MKKPGVTGFIVLLVVVAATFVISACGSGGSGSNTSAGSGSTGTGAGTGTGGASLSGVIGACSAPTDSPNYVMVYQSAQSMVCVDSTIWASSASAAAITADFPYFDAIIAQDKALFPAQAPNKPFIFQITRPTGSASTGCNYFAALNNDTSYCNSVTGDAFTNVYNDPVSGAPIPGFWGYLLSLHESVNVFTGLTSTGWPADWWADHRSPFPNTMDIEFTQAIANGSAPLSASVKSTLLAVSTAQSGRYITPSNPTGEHDTEVVLFANIFNGSVLSGSNISGFTGYHNMMQLVNADGINWDSVSQHVDTGDNDYSENLSEYVIAYLHLGYRSTVNATAQFASAGVGSLDTTIPAYTINATNVRAIANAHCSIRAASTVGVDVTQQLTALQSGNFANAIASGGTAASCPSECAYVNNACVAAF